MKDTTITCTTTNGNGNGVIGAAEASELDLRGASEEVLALAASINATNRRVVAEITEAKAEGSGPTKADAEAEGAVLTKADAEAEGPELTASEIPILSASEIPWDEPVASTMDRTLEGRLLRAIATGEGLEHPSPHLAAVQAFLDKHPPGCDVYGAESEFRDLLRFDVPKLSEDDWQTYRKQLAKGSGWRASHLDKQRRRRRA